MLPAFADLEGDFQIVDRGRIEFDAGSLGEADRVFFGDENGFDFKLFRGLVYFFDLVASEAVVVGEETLANDVRPLLFQYFDKAVRLGDAGHHHDGQILQKRQGEAAFRMHAYQFRGLVIAHENVGFIVISPDLLYELLFLFRRQVAGFCDEDVVGSLQLFDGLPQKAGGKHPFVSEGTVGVDQHHVFLAAQPHVLHAVVKDYRVDAEFPHGVAGAPHSVGIGYDNDVLKILGQHVRLVAGYPGA